MIKFIKPLCIVIVLSLLLSLPGITALALNAGDFVVEDGVLTSTPETTVMLSYPAIWG